jgi:hypothetical protein
VTSSGLEICVSSVKGVLPPPPPATVDIFDRIYFRLLYDRFFFINYICKESKSKVAIIPVKTAH